MRRVRITMAREGHGGQGLEYVGLVHDPEQPVTCVTALPAWQCSCGQVRFTLCYPDGTREWEIGGMVYRQCGMGPPQPVGPPPRLGTPFRVIREFRVIRDISARVAQALLADVLQALARQRDLGPADDADREPDALGYGDGTVVDAGTVKTLTDLARQNKETEFRELAACVGVPKEHLDELWTGARRRVHREAKAAP